MGRAGPDRVVLADPADLDRVALANREDPADLEAPAVLADRVGLADPEDTSRAAQAGTADMGLVALANRVGRVNRAARVDLVGMNLVVQEDRVAPANQVGMSPVIQADRDPGQNRARLGRSPVHPGRAAPTRAHPRRRLPDPHPTRAHPRRTRARPHLTRARPQEPTHPAGETRLAEVIHPAAATHPAGATPEPDEDGMTLRYHEFCSQSHGFENATANCNGAQMNN